ncbi:MAG: hypothetical protein D0530_00550 [Methylococcales bacterium]|jgi:hypothetical protein|nr:MAG: hypothetical protein D0530_00550 [Methylococcales bacterium]
MRILLNLPRIIAIPILLLIVVLSVLVFSAFFALLLIPLTIVGFKFWRALKLAKKNQHGDAIDAQFTVLEKTDKDY